MKRSHFNLILFIFLLISNVSYTQEIIYAENFNNDIGKGYDGAGLNDTSGVEWTLNIDSCIFNNSADYIKITSSNKQRLEAKDNNGEAIWKSPIIDISRHLQVNISVLTGETGSGKNINSKYIRLSYVLDGAAETVFFDSPADWRDSIVVLNNLNGNRLELIGRMKTNYSSDKVFIDSILIRGTPIPNDVLSQVLEPNAQVSSQQISSLNTNLNLAQSLLRFKLSEPSGGDMFATKIESIRFRNIATNNKTDLFTQFENFVLHDGSDFTPTDSVDINADELVLHFSEGVFSLPDDTNQEFELRAYLKSDGIVDNEKVQLELSLKPLGISTYESGSGIDTVNSQVVKSPEHQISVLATKLNFIDLPEGELIKNTNLSFSITATDQNGNVDLDADYWVHLSLVNGNGQLKGNLSQRMNLGRAVFDGLIYDLVEDIQIKAISETLDETISNVISVINSQTSNLELTGWEPNTTKISSLSTMKQNAVEVFRFKLIDLGDDLEPTFLNALQIIPAIDNTVNWEKTLAGFIVKMDGTELDVSSDFDNSSLIIRFAETELSRIIPDGSSRIFSIWTYLKETCIENQVLQLKIDSMHGGWETSGSGFLTNFSNDLLSPQFLMGVEGTELVFTEEPPQKIVPNKSFGMEFKLIDKYGNQDLNSNIETKLTLATGKGKLSSNSGLTKQMVLGSYLWDDLIYTKADNFRILIEADNLPSILSPNISALDRGSLILPSEEPLQSKSLNSMSVNIENSERVLKFIVQDSNRLDEMPTLITSMKFFNKLQSKGLDWKKHIGGAVLHQNGELIASTTKIEQNYISFTALNIDISNASEKEFSLGIYFKESMLPDKAKFQIEIRKNHSWKTSSSSSGLIEELPSNIYSAIHYIEVEADRYCFLSLPKGVESSQAFSFGVAAVDALHNIDTDVNSAIRLRKKKENGDLSHSNFEGYFSNGILNINNVIYSGSDRFSLEAYGNLANCDQSIFVQAKNIIVSNDFELNDLSKWTNISDWKVSTYKPIKGRSSLKHNLTNAVGTSFISTHLENISLNSGSIYWEFRLNNSDWDPSSSNNFVFHLLMNSDQPETASSYYSVGVNLGASDDKLSLWKTQDGDSDMLIQSSFDWNENETVAVRVKYTAKGEWQFDYNRLGDTSNYLSAGDTISTVEMFNCYSALQFNFGSATRAGELWFDDLTIESYNTAPFLRNYQIESDSIRLIFSENLNYYESSKLENFKLYENSERIPLSLIKESVKANELILILEDKLKTGTYQLQVNGVTDLEGAESDSEEIEFRFFVEPDEHDLVINELLADESPVVGLPEYEFIEIYNASNYPIKLENYKLRVDDSEKTLPDFELSAHDYLILCSNSAAALYNEFGNTLGLSSFPSLSNSDAKITIKSASGKVIDKLTYSTNWYDDIEKKKGGWSLERIDINNHSWQADNWETSTDESGGTPGKVNSVAKHNADIIAPQLLRFELNSSNSIDLFFSETLNSNFALKIENYSLTGGNNKLKSIAILDDAVCTLRLNFISEFEHNTIFELCLSNQLVDLAGNSLIDCVFEFSMANIPKTGDLIINEVLFNPYAGAADFVELLNVSDQMIDMKDVLLANRDDKYQLDAIYPISTKSIILDAGKYILLSVDTLTVKENYSHFNENAFLQIKKMPPYSNSKGRVVLLNCDNEILDDFAYNENMHFQLLTNKEGVSLERINPKKETNTISNWKSAAQSFGFGTPGVENSSYDADEIEVNVVGFKSKLFSPDNDGVDDRLIINFDLEKSGYVTNIRIYNSSGVEVRRLASNLTISAKDEMFWDGLLKNKERASIGIYVLYFELFHPDGDVKTYKKTCILAGKLK